MSSCTMKNQDSDEEVDLEALRLAALKSRKPKYANHNNLISIVPVAVESPDFVNTKIKLEKISPAREVYPQGEKKAEKENEDEKASNYSELTVENDQDILSMDDKEEEDSLERLMDQLEAEISGKAPISTNRIVLSSKNLSGGKKTSKKSEKEGFDDEIELVQVKTRKEPNAIIEIRESASPEPNLKGTSGRKSGSPKLSPSRRSRSKLRSRSRSPFLRERSYRRSRSPYWSRSPCRSRSPFRRSRSPYWTSRWTRSKSRSPFRRYRSPLRKRSPFSRFSRSRSISYGRRSPWSLSPRRRSKSPFYHDGLLHRYRSFNSPRRSFSPRKSSKSPRRRSRSPRRYCRNSPYRIYKSPFRRSRSPFRRTPRRSQSPFLHRPKSPLRKYNSPNRSPVGKRYSNSPGRRSLPKSSEKSPTNMRSKSPVKRYETSRRSPGQLKDGRSLSISGSPTPRRNRSPLKAVEKNKLDGNEKTEKLRERSRGERRHRSLSRENRGYDRRPFRQKYARKFSPTKSRKSKSPKSKTMSEKGAEEPAQQDEKEQNSTPAVPLDPILEARKKKFENLGEVDPTVDKKINLKAIKESTENPEEDEDALTINLESNLWDESEESEDEFESRFKSDGARKNRVGSSNRTVLSFRNLRDGDAVSKKINLNKPLIDDNRRDRFRRERHDSWLQGRRSERNERKRKHDGRSDEKDSSKNKSKGNDKSTSTSSSKPEKRSDRKPIIWSSKNERKLDADSKDNEVSTTQTEVRENKSKSSERTIGLGRDKLVRNDSNVHEADDFEKLISDFEKELESDACVTTKAVNSTVSTDQGETKRPKLSTNKDSSEPKVEPTVKKQVPRIVKISEATSNKIDKSCEIKNTNKHLEATEKVEVEEAQHSNDGPEDYIEDDDFVLEVSAARKQKSKGEEEDSQSDLRAVLSRRRNERLTKAVSLQENMPTRLVQSAFQGLGNKKSKRQIREVQDTSEFASLDKNAGAEGRRVLLLHREKNPIPSLKCTVPEVKPDTTIHRRFTRSNPRRKRKLHRQLDTIEDADQEEEEQEEFEMEEEKQFRRFRLKRNVTLSSQSLVFMDARFGCLKQQFKDYEVEIFKVQRLELLTALVCSLLPSKRQPIPISRAKILTAPHI